MVTMGQRQRSLKLTDKDVRSAASLILDELLEGRIDKEFKGHRKIRRNRTGPETEKLGVRKSESEVSVTRSQTLPSNYRELSDSEIKQKNAEGSPVAIQREVIPQSVDSSGSSADTESNLSNISEKRKKKSFLKRARERLRFAFHRNHDKENAAGKETNGKSHSEKQKAKKNTGKSINESQHHSKALNGGMAVDGTEDVNSVGKDGDELQSAKKWNSNIFSSFRKPKKSHEAASDPKFQKSFESKDHGHENGRNGVDKSVPGKVVPPSTLQIQSRPPGVLSLPRQTSTSQQDRPDSPQQPILPSPGHYQFTGGSVASHGTTPLSLPGASISSDGNVIFSSTRSAVSDSDFPPDIGHRNLRLNTTQSIYSNVLDSPGEDIEYIDAVDTENRNESGRGSYSKQVQNSASLYQFHASSLKDSRPTNQFVDGAHLTNGEISPGAVFIQGPDGGTEAASTTRARYGAPGEEYDELDGLMDDPDNGPHSDPDREALYSMIAQRLIEMGDSFSASGSDQKSKSEGPESKQSLSPLETDIIDCLRSVGDKMTKDGKDQMYRRFESTVRNSFQGEISWNHLAVLFYTTKNVISFVGKSSRAAVLAKDLTVQFVSDKCASWIIDQVGSDFLQSSEESDFGVD